MQKRLRLWRTCLISLRAIVVKIKHFQFDLRRVVTKESFAMRSLLS